MSKGNLGAGVQSLDTALEQVWGVQVVVSYPLEELAVSLLHHEVVIERRASVVGVMHVPYAGIDGLVVPGNLGRPIG
jgi:hypothetical protein